MRTALALAELALAAGAPAESISVLPMAGPRAESLVADDRFAAVIAAGVFTDGHAPLDGLDELVRVTRPAHHACALRLALFTSRRESVEASDAYRCLIEDCGPLVKLRRDDWPKAQSHLCLAPGTPRSWCVTGPARLAVETRLLYPSCPCHFAVAVQRVPAGKDRIACSAPGQNGGDARPHGAPAHV